MSQGETTDTNQAKRPPGGSSRAEGKGAGEGGEMLARPVPCGRGMSGGGSTARMDPTRANVSQVSFQDPANGEGVTPGWGSEVGVHMNTVVGVFGKFWSPPEREKNTKPSGREGEQCVVVPMGGL